MPRYMLAKKLKCGLVAYYFNPPSRSQDLEPDDPRGRCPVGPEKLGTDYAAAKQRVETVLLPVFDSWRTGGLSDMVPRGPREGSFDWMAGIFKSHRFYLDTDKATQRTYDQGLALVSDYALKDGMRVGQKLIVDMTPDFVDLLYSKLLIVEEEAEDGTVIKRERRAFANAAMRSCRRAWNVAHRAKPKLVPAANPFSKMGLKARAPGEIKEETPTATWDELLAFRAKAIELGERDLATAALASWEWLQRGEHIFTEFEIAHYRPKHRPDMVRVVHPKTGEQVWWPLFTEADEKGRREPLFPELMAELDAIKGTMLAGLVFRRGRTGKPWPIKSGDLTYMRQRVREVIAEAGLRPELSFASFRHGGLTETGEAEMTDREIQTASRHKSPRILPTYVKATRKILISGALKRRATRTKAGDLSE